MEIGECRVESEECGRAGEEAPGAEAPKLGITPRIPFGLVSPPIDQTLVVRFNHPLTFFACLLVLSQHPFVDRYCLFVCFIAAFIRRSLLFSITVNLD